MEWILCFFAAVGITYLLRDFMLFLIYRKREEKLYLSVSLRDHDRQSLCRLFRHYSDVQDSFPGKALLGGLCFVGTEGGGLSYEEALTLAEIFDIPVKKRSRRIARRRFSVRSDSE